MNGKIIPVPENWFKIFFFSWFVIRKCFICGAILYTYRPGRHKTWVRRSCKLLLSRRGNECSSGEGLGAMQSVWAQHQENQTLILFTANACSQLLCQHNSPFLIFGEVWHSRGGLGGWTACVVYLSSQSCEGSGSDHIERRPLIDHLGKPRPTAEVLKCFWLLFM